MAHVSHKLSNSVEGALAGGGDPATSPLYVFGPFLRLIVVAGVASITFGTTIWLVVFTVAMVSAMYRLVILWVTDGSGGSGLSEEEFGSWAVKINAAITFVEYTLTFLVSMAAMVTFLADRLPILNTSILGIQYRTIIAIALSILTGWLVNRGPKTAARAFGPATAGVLLLLWAMILATILKYGLHLPKINLGAFSGEYLHFTFGGFTRMLAVMTGIEVFANLVAAYDGSPREKSNKAFGSLLLIMGTTAVTMLIVGPAIYAISIPIDPHVSVFTQTMDVLLPQPLAYMGTLIGIAVLLSASAASAQGLQNLALGLSNRNYIPAYLGQRNKFDVADKPVWLEVGLVIFIFLLAGTNEVTYLALYAAGVFVLLSMTGWAASKRLIRELGRSNSSSHLLTLIGTITAATITSAATVVIFQERFFEGAWTYFIFIPILFAAFTYYRSKLGAPSPVAEQLGSLEEAMLGGFGFGQAHEAVAITSAGPIVVPLIPITQDASYSASANRWQSQVTAPKHILVPLDGSEFAEQALPAAEALCTAYEGRLTLLTVKQKESFLKSIHFSLTFKGKRLSINGERETYLQKIENSLEAKGIEVDHIIRTGKVAESINGLVKEIGVDMVVISSHGRSGVSRLLLGSVANQVLQQATYPIMVVHPIEGVTPAVPKFKKLLVTLDGSEFAERVLPYVKASVIFESVVLLISVPQVPEAEMYGAVVNEIRELRKHAETEAKEYLDGVSTNLQKAGVNTTVIVTGSRPAQTIISVAQKEKVDVIMMATHGRGGMDSLIIGSVAERIVQNTCCPVFLVPIRERRQEIKTS
ncbi:MAG: universal stress protein [Anaerolineales bacterium]